MCDSEGCTTGTIGLPNPKRVASRKCTGSSILTQHIQVPARVFTPGESLRARRSHPGFLFKLSRQGIARFSARMEFWRGTGPDLGCDGIVPFTMPAQILFGLLFEVFDIRHRRSGIYLP